MQEYALCRIRHSIDKSYNLVYTIGMIFYFVLLSLILLAVFAPTFVAIIILFLSLFLWISINY